MIPGFDPTKTFKLTIDHNKVDEELTDFPLLVNLTDSSGTVNTTCSGIFEELSIFDSGINTNIRLLIHADTPLGTQTVEDSCSYNNSITSNDVISSGDQYKYGSTSLYFAGTVTSYLSLSSTNFQFGLDDFTIDFWAYLLSSSYHIINMSNYNTGGMNISVYQNTLYFGIGGGFQEISFTVTLDSWAHIAIVRSSGIFKVFLNGVEKWEISNVTTATLGGSGDTVIGYDTQNFTVAKLKGYLEEFQISKEVKWWDDFIPPYLPYDSYTRVITSNNKKIAIEYKGFEEHEVIDTDTKFLITSSETSGVQDFIDSSASAHTITVVGNTLHTDTQKKFGDTAIYFDGSDDEFSVNASEDFTFGTGDFTIDLWVHPVAWDSSGAFFFLHRLRGGDNRGWQLNYSLTNGVTLGLDTGASFYGLSEETPNLTLGVWQHVALVRLSGHLYLFINGVIVANDASFSYDFPASSDPLIIGLRKADSNYDFNGYLDELRISKGIARWTSNFTPPTAPHEPDSYTKLLIHSDSGSNYTFTDESANSHAITRYGDLYHSTDVTKFDTSSMYFNGNTYYLSTTPHEDWDLGISDFTIDWWEYRLSKTSTDAVGHIKSTSGYPSIIVGYTDGGGIYFYMSSTGASWDVQSLKFADNGATNVWVHYAVVRTGSTFITFKNGVRQYTDSSSESVYYSSGSLEIGHYSTGFKGYIKHFRFTKGKARWFANFTPDTSNPTATKLLTAPENQQCYVEIERWDATNREAQLWAKIPKISPDKDTELLLYYDITASDNALYIGETNSTPAENVWDSNFFAVYNLSQIPTGANCLLESTLNHRHGSTSNMGITNSIGAVIGKGVYMDGIDNSISFGFSVLPVKNMTMQIVYNIQGNYSRLIDNGRTNEDYPTYMITVGNDGTTTIHLYSGASHDDLVISNSTLPDKYNQLSSVWEGNELNYYLNAKAVYKNEYNTFTIGTNARNYYSGKIDNGDTYYEQSMRSMHISIGRRSEGWIKTSYYSNFDDLISFRHESYSYKGFVEVEGFKTERKVMLFERATGLLVDTVMSDPNTGQFVLNVPYSELYFLIILPEINDAYNLIALDKLDPTV